VLPRASSEGETATYYDVLGVSAEASHDEVKRAFTERALRYHPSRQAPDDPAAAERAAWRLREVNEAWETLRNPSARAAYDQGLLPASSRELVGVGAAAIPAYDYGGTSALFQEPEVAEIEPADDEEAVPRTRAERMWASAPMLLGGFVLFSLIVLAAVASRTDDAVDVQTQERLAKNACVVVIGDETQPDVREVPCSAPHDGKVVSKVDIPQACPISTRNILLPAIEKSVCIR
jgi:hypothetical protein